MCRSTYQGGPLDAGLPAGSILTRPSGDDQASLPFNNISETGASKLVGSRTQELFTRRMAVGSADGAPVPTGFFSLPLRRYCSHRRSLRLCAPASRLNTRTAAAPLHQGTSAAEERSAPVYSSPPRPLPMCFLANLWLRKNLGSTCPRAKGPTDAACEGQGTSAVQFASCKQHTHPLEGRL